MKRLALVLVILMAVVTLAFAGGSSEPAGTGKLTVQIFDRGTDGGRTLAQDNAWMTWIKEKVKKDLGIDVTFVPVGRWTEETDMNNLMASGNAPDLCYSYNNTKMLENFRDQGGLLNLAPYIDKYLPDLKKLLGEDPVYTGKDFIRRKEMGKDKAIYWIPSARVALAQRSVFIRKDWLDKLGLKVPANLQQFHDALIAFRDNDPGSVGRNRVVPFGANKDTRWEFAEFILNSYPRGLSDRDKWVNYVPDTERAFNTPGYKDGVRLLNTWYNEKLIYQDFPLMPDSGDQFSNQLKSGVVGAFAGNWDFPYRVDYKINEDLAKNIPGASFIPVDLGLNNRLMMDKQGLFMFIPSYSKNQIDALRYLNWLSKYENYHFIQVGNEGVNHRMVNGVPQIIASTDPKWIQNSAQNIDITMPLNGVQMGNTEMNSRVLALSYGNVPADTIVNAYNVSVKGARPSIIHDELVTTVNQYGTALVDKVDALVAQSIRAAPADFDRIWDAGVKDLLSSGAQEMLNERAKLLPR